MQTGRDLFVERAESQRTQNLVELWEPFRPALAWMYVAGEAHGELLEAFLMDTALPGGAMAELGERVALYMLDELAGDAPRWEDLEAMARRALALAPGLDWWRVQNRLWELIPEVADAAPLARLLGFGPEALDIARG